VRFPSFLAFSRFELTFLLPVCRKLVKHISSRSTEALKRPEALISLSSTLESASTFLTSARTNFTSNASTSAPQRFTSDELDKFEKLVNGVKEWVGEAQKKLEKAKAHEDPAVKVAEIERKTRDVEAELKKLEKKKMPRRKKVVSSSSSSAKAAETETAKGEEPTAEHKKDEL
jgi:hypoxia up-regulated 1